MKLLNRRSIALLAAILAVVFVFSQCFENVTYANNGSPYREEILNGERVIDIRIEISQEDWQDMLDNPLQEAFHPVNVTIDGITMNTVGLRTKGNSSLSQVASNSNSNRYSFKIQFDEYVSDQTFFGMEVLNLNNMISDSSYMREYITYKIMEDMGMYSPAMNYANIYINGELFGLYLAIENIGASYLQYHFGDIRGDLYKPEGTGADLVWRGNDISSYPGLILKSNNSNAGSNILNMLDVLNNSNSKEELEKVLDIDQALMYMATNAILENTDSYIGQMTHNYYLYEVEGKFIILPWDYNLSFGGMGNMGGNRMQREQPWADVSQQQTNTENNAVAPVPQNDRAMNRVGGGMGNNAIVSTNFSYIDSPISGEKPLFTKLMEVEEYKEKYHEYCRLIAEKYLAEDYFDSLVDKLYQLICKDVQNDPTKFYTYEDFEIAVSDTKGLKFFASKRAENVLQQLNGEIASYSSDTNSLWGNMGGRGFGGNRNDSASTQQQSLLGDITTLLDILKNGPTENTLATGMQPPFNLDDVAFPQIIAQELDQTDPQQNTSDIPEDRGLTMLPADEDMALDVFSQNNTQGDIPAGLSQDPNIARRNLNNNGRPNNMPEGFINQEADGQINNRGNIPEFENFRVMGIRQTGVDQEGYTNLVLNLICVVIGIILTMVFILILLLHSRKKKLRIN